MKNQFAFLLIPALALASVPGNSQAQAPKVVSPGGNGTYLTGGYVPPFAPDSVINTPIGGRLPITQPAKPIAYTGKAAGRAPVTNRWWQALNMGPFGVQLSNEVDGKKVPIPAEADFTNFIIANPLQFLFRRDGLAFSQPSAFVVSKGGDLGLQALAGDQIRPAQTDDLKALAQVIVSSSAVPNRRTLGPDWQKTGKRFTKMTVSDFSDWWVETTFATDDGTTMVTSFAAGSPMWFGRFSQGGTAEVSVNNLAANEISNSAETLVLEVTYGVAAYQYEGGVIPTNGQVKQLYAFYGEPGSTWVKKPADKVNDPGTVVYTNTFEGGAPARDTHFAAAVIPNADLAPTLKNYSMSPVTKSTVTPVLQKQLGTITVDFEVTAPVVSGISNPAGYLPGTVFALFPHQYQMGIGDGFEFNPTKGKMLKDPANPSSDASLPTLRGPAKFYAGSAFQLKYKVPPAQRALLPSKAIQWADPATPERQILERLLDPQVVLLNDLDGDSTTLDTYNGGKRMAKYANAAAIAEAVGSPHYAGLIARADKFLTGSDADKPNGSAAGWFQATTDDGKVKNSYGPVFWYDQSWKTLIGYPTGYGSALNINDHHFHYGYMLRTAAELVRANPKWKSAWGPMVQLLIDDIITTERDQKADPNGLQFPFLRTFDPWYGHSWATGVNNEPGDGGDQESTSEAMNAWTGVLLWARETGDTKLETWSSWLLASEARAARMYWFDVSGQVWRNRLPSFKALPTFVICFVGKLSTTNWFNVNWSTRLGIQLLPISPVSIYHGSHPDAVARTINLWLKLQGITDFKDLAQWKAGNDQRYVFWFDTFWPFFALSGDPAHVAFAKKIVTPSTPGGTDSILESFPVSQNANTPEKMVIFNQFDQGNSKANVFWFIQNAKANLTGQTAPLKTK